MSKQQTEIILIYANGKIFSQLKITVSTTVVLAFRVHLLRVPNHGIGFGKTFCTLNAYITNKGELFLTILGGLVE